MFHLNMQYLPMCTCLYQSLIRSSESTLFCRSRIRSIPHRNGSGSDSITADYSIWIYFMNFLKLLTNTTSDGVKMQHLRQHIKLEGGTWTCTTKGQNPQHWKKSTNMGGKLVNCKPVPLMHNLRFPLPTSTSTELIQALTNLQISKFKALSKRKKSGNMSNQEFPYNFSLLSYKPVLRWWGDDVTQ